MRTLFCFLMLALLPLNSLAGDLAATFKNADGSTMTISARDSQHVRMASAPDAYTLMNGSKIYMVSRDDEGKWHVMDMDQMAGMMGALGGGDAETSDYEASFKDTGRTEQIAGYTGKVYQVEVKENGKLVSNDEVVFSTHEDITAINQAWLAMAKQMSSIMSMDMTEIMDDSTNHGYGGMLRHSTDMVLQRLDTGNLSADYFDLPAGAEQTQMPAQHNSGAEPDAVDVGNLIQGLFN